MEYSDERIRAICRLDAVEGRELLAKGRAGDLEALGDWLVHSSFTLLLQEGHLDYEAAVTHTCNIFAMVDIKPAMVP